MPTYYVGSGGNDGNSGATWALRKLTLNGAENIPVAAGDTVYVGAGTYRELLTVDVSGSAGSPVTYIGDYTGANTDGTGGVVRITGSDNDQTATRANCVTANTKNYRTFRGFVMDLTTSHTISLLECSNLIVEQCVFPGSSSNAVYCSGATQLANIVRRCYFRMRQLTYSAVQFTHTSDVDDVGSVVENCLILGGGVTMRTDNIGGIIIRNCTVMFASQAVRVSAAMSAGQTLTVNNCILAHCSTGVWGSSLGDVVENYNTFYDNATDRNTVNTGANSVTYPPLFDSRWFFEAINGGTLVTPFDLASYSQLVNVAGTSPPTADLRGTTVIGAQREWGPLEYDATLEIEAGSGGGGAVSISPFRGNF